MKKVIALTILGMFLTLGQVFAESKTFIVSAIVPNTTSISITANEINSSSGQWTPVSGLTFPFGSLTFNPTTGNLVASKYYAVDVSAQGPNNGYLTQIDYTEGGMPANQPNGHGLGWKSIATFVKTSGSGTNTTDQLLPQGKKLLKDLQALQINSNAFGSGWLRAYVGLVTLDPLANPPDPAGSETFNANDKPGTFDGTLTFTATLL